MALAKRWPVEVISMDSALVYRGMDVGTAKPSAADRQAVTHHLIDILDPSQAYSAAKFVHDTARLVQSIHDAQRVPLIVGGTMLYLKAWLQGLDDMPAADAATRERIDARAHAEGWPALHAELARVDPTTAARLAPMDSQRIQRALEVFMLTGKPMSALHSQSVKPEPAVMGRVISLEPLSRPWLHERIATRLTSMLEQGLVDEVRALRQRGDLHADMPSMRCVGYRQTWQALDRCDLSQASDLQALKDQASAATRQLAKRQVTWLRSMPLRQVIACDGADPTQVVAAVERAVAAIFERPG
jgi:tRNA dimethylallyltransferase